MALLDKHFAWEKKILKIRSDYAKKMSKSLSGKTVAKFFQIVGRRVKDRINHANFLCDKVRLGRAEMADRDVGFAAQKIADLI